ncbi:hypothetical protein ACVNIS_06425 [Sphaerotilaceae bacterium SBD11-9]
MQLSPVEVAKPKRTCGRPFPKGISPNPGGRPKHVLPDGRSVAQAAREATPKALCLLLRAIEDEEQPMGLRVAAAQAILRTGHADAVKSDKPDMAGITFTIQSISFEAGPPCGVISDGLGPRVLPADMRELPA